VKKTDKRDRVVRAALELIAEHGFHGAPMALIAQKAEVATGTIYRYFKSKDVLIQELYLDLESKIIAHISDGYSDDNSLRERFLHLGKGLLRYFIAYPLDFRYLEQFHNSPYGVVCRRDKLLGKTDNYDILVELFNQGVNHKVTKNLPLIALFALGFGPLITIARDQILGFVDLDEHLIGLTVNACWDSVKR
jgi:TetR/AcrR family transcriptional regulator, repressor of fatR-cypB operon